MKGEDRISVTYVLSDIHGNMKYFESVMERIELKKDDVLYILGDVIDRCPYGLDILRKIMNMPNARMLLGNHEYMMMRALEMPYDGKDDIYGKDIDELFELWYYNGGLVTHNAWKKLSEDARMEIEYYLKSLPLSFDAEINGRRFKLCHAAPEDMYERSDKSCTKTYFCVWERDSIRDMPEFYPEHTVIFGHTPTWHFQNDFPVKIWRHKNLMGIDCGAGYADSPYDIAAGARLACLRLDDMKEFYSSRL